MPSVDTAPLLKDVILLLPAETCKTHQRPKAQSDFTVVFEGKVMQNMGFLALQVKRRVRRPLGGGVWSLEPGPVLAATAEARAEPPGWWK